MLQLFVRSLIALSSLSPSFAGDLGRDTLKETPVNAPCLKARLHSLRVEEISRISAKTNFCHEDASKLPVRISNTIEQIGVLNRKAAEFLGIPAEKLLPSGLSVHLSASALGPLGSQANRELYLGVFPDWDMAHVPKGESPINDAIYLHELGHVLMVNANPHLPGTGAELQRSSFLAEAVADLLAISLAGGTISKQSDIPLQAELRPMGAEASYRAPKEFFDILYVDRRIEAICKELEAGKHTDHSRVFCGQSLGHDIPLAKKKHGLDKNAPFPAIDSTKSFDPSDVSKQRRVGHLVYDSHQLSVPINSFLIALGKKINKPVQLIFLRAIAKISHQQIRLKASCTLQAPGVSEAAAKANAIQGFKTSFSSVLSAVRDEYTEEELKIAQELWNERGMNAAVVLADEEARDSVLRSTKAIMIQKMTRDTSGFYAENKACLRTLRSTDYPAIEGPCSIRCELTP